MVGVLALCQFPVSVEALLQFGLSPSYCHHRYAWFQRAHSAVVIEQSTQARSRRTAHVARAGAPAISTFRSSIR